MIPNGGLDYHIERCTTQGAQKLAKFAASPGISLNYIPARFEHAHLSRVAGLSSLSRPLQPDLRHSS